MGRVTAHLVRGDVWDAEFDPVRGREQAGRRPAVIVSSSDANRGRSELVFVVPMTRRDRGIPSHVPIQPPEGGLTSPSVIMCEQLRTFSVERLLRRRGTVSLATLREIEWRLRYLLDFE
ncbi:MAG: type II toxin-antitoxin system PemK/MazF family toxin [Thermomicrobiales bacterium]